MTDKMQKALRHIETAVDVDEWAMVTVKECFEKLDKIEQIINSADTRNVKVFKIEKVLEHE